MCGLAMRIYWLHVWLSYEDVLVVVVHVWLSYEDILCYKASKTTHYKNAH